MSEFTLDLADLGQEAFELLKKYAAHEERSPVGQAKMLLLDVLGAHTEFKIKSSSTNSRSTAASKSHRTSTAQHAVPASVGTPVDGHQGTE